MQGEVAIITGGASRMGRRSGESLVWHDVLHAGAVLSACAAQALGEDNRAAEGQALAGAAVPVLFDSGAA